MTTKNKSFILHLDSLNILEKMTDEQAGKFIKSIYKYKKNKEIPELDFGLEMAIAPFINQFKRDDEKYQSIVERNKINGSKGGRPKNPKNPVGYSETQNNPSEPKKPTLNSDNKKDNDNKNKKDNKKEDKKNTKKTFELKFIKNQDFKKLVLEWLDYKKREFGFSYKSEKTIKVFFDELMTLSNGNLEVARQIIGKSISSRYKGIFELKPNQQQKQKSQRRKNVEMMAQELGFKKEVRDVRQNAID